VDELLTRLDRVVPRFSDPAFLGNRGLANEVGIYFFCYNGADEPVVDRFIENLKAEQGHPFRPVHRDLYAILLDICRERLVLDKIPQMEEQKGKQSLLQSLQRLASPAAFADKIGYKPHLPGDILLITGVGRVYPFMRAHRILEDIQVLFEDIPIVLFYPGTFDGANPRLFGKLEDGNYYRAFNLL